MYTTRANFETLTWDLKLRNKIWNTGWDLPRIRRWSPATYFGGTASIPGPVHAGFAVEKSGTGAGFSVSAIHSINDPYSFIHLSPTLTICAIERDAESYVTSADSYSEHNRVQIPTRRAVLPIPLMRTLGQHLHTVTTISLQILPLY